MVREGAAAMNTEGIETPLCDACRRIPLTHLGLDVPEPLEGWTAFFEKRGVTVMDDAVGRPSVARHVLTALIDERKELEARLAEQSAQKVAAQQPAASVPAGIPAREGLSAHESMISGPGYVSARNEFEAFPRPRFLEEQLEEGRKHQLAERAAVKRRKERKQ